jgi:DNA-binding NarL/FixJ family response regulator
MHLQFIQSTLMKRITILLAEDHEIVGQGLRTLLELETDFVVIGSALDGRSAVVLAKKLRPEVIVMDIGMPLMNGLEATRQIAAALPATKVLILSAHPDDAYVREALDAGASGYILKQSTSQEVCGGIRVVRDGKAYFSPAIATRIHRILPDLEGGRPLPGNLKRSLTSREREVLQLIAEGKANKETADELGISIKTVEKHRSHLMAKLDIHHTAGLTRYALDEGIIESRFQPD